MHLNPSPARLFSPRRFWACLTASLCVAFIVSLPAPILAARPGNINHVVIFWLKRPGNGHDLARLRRASESFRVMPDVLRVDVGRGLPVRRPGIEQAFDLCVVFTFRNQAALDRFAADPRHKAAIQSVLKPLVKRYTVFNAVAD
jgi:hypothetical protein